MVSITLAVPPDMKKEMDAHPEMNWSEVARQAIRLQLNRQQLLKRLDKLTEKSTLTEEDAIELGRKVRRGVGERYRKISRK